MTKDTSFSSGSYNRQDYAATLANIKRQRRLIERRVGQRIDEAELIRRHIRECAKERLQEKLAEYGRLAIAAGDFNFGVESDELNATTLKSALEQKIRSCLRGSNSKTTGFWGLVRKLI